MRLSVLRRTSKALPRSNFFSSTFAHDLPQAKGSVDVIYLPPRSGYLPSSVIVFFPGNPGLIQYYTAFLIRLHFLIDSSHAIIGLSHLGHCPDRPHPVQPLSLSEQIDAKCEFVRVLRQDLDSLQAEALNGETADDRPEPIKISLMGHSVGAEMCVQAMRRLEDPSVSEFSEAGGQPVRISALFLLCPTLANIARTPNGRHLRPIFHFPLIQLLPMLAYLLKPLLWLLSVFQSSSSSIYAPNPTTLSFLNSPTTISHILQLARSEMSTILDPNIEFYARPDVRARTYAYFGHGDGWVGEEADEVKDVLTNGTRQGEEHLEQEQLEVDPKRKLERMIDCVDGVPHAFCLGETHTAIVARKVAEFVRQALSR